MQCTFVILQISCSVDMYGGSAMISVNIGEETREKVCYYVFLAL